MSGEDSSGAPEDFPADDPTSALDQLDAELEELVIPNEPGSPLSRRELEELVEQVIAEELARLAKCEK